VPVQGSERRGELGALPGGHHGLSRQQILESQRERLLAAVAGEVAEHGYRATTITAIVKQASVSTRDFYEHFDSKEECYLAAFDAVCGHLRDLVVSAAADQEEWPQQIIVAVGVVLRFFAAEPDLARVCLVEPVSATPRVAIRFREVVLTAVPGLARGREEIADDESLPLSTEESLIGGAVSLATRCVLAGEAERLTQVLPDLVEFLLVPFLGPDRAAELASATGDR
jgi:AcrR family transcriptional regulator